METSKGKRGVSDQNTASPFTQGPFHVEEERAEINNQVRISTQGHTTLHDACSTTPPQNVVFKGSVSLIDDL